MRDWSKAGNPNSLLEAVERGVWTVQQGGLTGDEAVRAIAKSVKDFESQHFVVERLKAEVRGDSPDPLAAIAGKAAEQALRDYWERVHEGKRLAAPVAEPTAGAA